MRHDRRSERPTVGQNLFAARQVYVRSGPRAHYVVLSRSLQISVAAAMGLALLWLALASCAAIAKHLETVEQRRELARLESLARTLRTTVEDVRSVQGVVDREPDAAPALIAELTAVRAGRERALALAETAAAEANELRHEVALANERIRELKDALAQARANHQPLGDRIARLQTGGREATARAGRPAADPACPPH